MPHPEQYWHCKVELTNSSTAILNDLSFKDLTSKVVDKWLARQPFSVNGVIVRDIDQVEVIKITQTPNNVNHYEMAYQREMRGSAFVDLSHDPAELPIDQGTDFTNELLFNHSGSRAAKSGADVSDIDIEILERIFSHFHIVCRQLRTRHDNRPTIDVADEYDVQDLMHAILSAHFNDIRPEEYVPSHAGASSRADFLLKQERIVIETKMSRKGIDAKKLGEELLIDIRRYKNHPDCSRLICFVYDPDGRIRNPRGLEHDLSGNHDCITVNIYIAPK